MGLMPAQISFMANGSLAKGTIPILRAGGATSFRLLVSAALLWAASR
jgi:hypothetical protein